MAKLSKEKIQQELQEKGFKLVDSSNYQTLASPIIIECEHGHKIESATVELSTLEESNRNDTSKRKIPIKSRWTKFHSNGK